MCVLIVGIHVGLLKCGWTTTSDIITRPSLPLETYPLASKSCVCQYVSACVNICLYLWLSFMPRCLCVVCVCIYLCLKVCWSELCACLRVWACLFLTLCLMPGCVLCVRQKHTVWQESFTFMCMFWFISLTLAETNASLCVLCVQGVSSHGNLGKSWNFIFFFQAWQNHGIWLKVLEIS